MFDTTFAEKIGKNIIKGKKLPQRYPVMFQKYSLPL